ncbi:MAG: hypothetical protein CM1200mP18_13640 [Gammaproteobacteria bacterium]|nr:MAG: hypothetical protein CM1200mP18_13640 [Gammaproteobacteria bacterium]
MTTGRKQVALVTGGRSGIGQACARNWLPRVFVCSLHRGKTTLSSKYLADLADTTAPAG